MVPPGVHPPPPADLHTRTPLIHESPGPWQRICRIDREPLHFSRGPTSRFNDPAGEFGVLYVAGDPEGAFLETFGRQLGVRTVTSTALSRRSVWQVESDRALRLVDLVSPGSLPRLSADNRLTSGSVAVAQAWSRALWQHPIEVDGIHYRLRHDPARSGYAIFDRAAAHLSVTFHGTLWDPSRRRQLGRLLDDLGFALIVEREG